MAVLGISGTIQAQNAAYSDIPPTYVAGEAFLVAIVVYPDEEIVAYSVEDKPPTGWTVSEISDGGRYDNVTKSVKWGLFPDDQVRMVTYMVLPPANATGDKTFVGSATFEGARTTIEGQRTTSLAPPPTPLKIENIAVDGDTVFITLTGTISTNYRLEVSSDFTHWDELPSFTLETSPMTVNDTGASTTGQRYYRIRKVD